MVKAFGILRGCILGMTTRELYAKALSDSGVLSVQDTQAMVDNYRDKLDRGEQVQDSWVGQSGNEFTVDWSRYLEGDLSVGTETRLAAGRTQTLGHALVSMPADLTLHNRVQRVIDERARMLAGEKKHHHEQGRGRLHQDPA